MNKGVLRNRVQAILERMYGVLGKYKRYEEGNYTSLEQIAPLMYKAVYSNINYDLAYKHFQMDPPIVRGLCSAIKSGNYFGRNLDWFDYDTEDNAQLNFYVETNSSEYRKVRGIAAMEGLTKAAVLENPDNELFKLLPFYLQDGFNGSLFACVNVVPSDKGDNTFSIPTEAKVDTVCTTMLVRYVLDRFDDATEACEYIKKHVSVYIPQKRIDMKYDLHFMIGDSNHTYVLEIVNNSIVYTENNIMTNFHVNGVNFLSNGKVYTNADVSNNNLPSSLGITDFGAGLERYNILVDGSNDVRTLMNSLLYSKTYDLNTTPYWYSEFTINSSDYTITVDTPPNDETMQLAIDIAQKIKRGEMEGNLWITTHSVVYNLTNGEMDVVSYEDVNNNILIDKYGKTS